MQTAVDFLLEKITLKKLENDVYLYPRITNEDIEQAKEMFEQQIEKAYYDGKQDIPSMSDEEYYNETYKKQL